MSKHPKAFAPSGYYRVRLEHTLRHTQQSTRLIYLVNGGALALLYFAVQLKELASFKGYVAATGLLTLSAINYVHARLIRRQGEWYRIIDRYFREASDAKEIVRPEGTSTHDLYARIHFIIAAVLAFLAVACAFLPQLS